MTSPRPIRIFDTTLRDGEQSPGASMNLAEKLEIAQALVQLGVDIIEAGFPIASPGDFESVREIAAAVQGATVCGLARCNDTDIDRAWEALKPAGLPRIHVFLATSSIHREFKLRMTEEEVLARAVAGVTRARNHCADVEFSPEDAARTEIDARAREILRNDVVGGAFVQEWSTEQATGGARLQALTQRALQHPMSIAEDHVIAAMQAVHRTAGGEEKG
jgi:2-isopropylmalate synthase